VITGDRAQALLAGEGRLGRGRSLCGIGHRDASGVGG
jgi:hypothetical protein